MPLQVLPSRCPIKPQHARDLAEACVIALRASTRDLALFIGPDGAVAFQWLRRNAEPDATLAGCLRLVGRYTGSATVHEIRDDILAMECEPIHGSAE